MHDLTPKQLETMWDNDAAQRKEQKRRQDYYDGKHGIVGKGERYVDGSPKSELVANWVKYGVDMYVGAITSQGYTITDRNEDAKSDGPGIYADIAAENDLDAIDTGNLENALTKGYGLEVHEYIDGRNVITECDPVDWSIIYDSNDTLIGAVYRKTITKDTYHRGDLLEKDVEQMVVYTASHITEYERRGQATGDNAGWQMVDKPVPHVFGRVPVVVWKINSKSQGILTDDLLGQVDEYNEIDSMSGDDIRGDSDGLLIIKGYSKDDILESADAIRQSKILPLAQDGDASYLQKHTDTERVEKKLTRTRELIHVALKVPDVNAIVGATGETSGIALQLKFKPMVENAHKMIIHIKAGMRDRIDLINAMIGKAKSKAIEDYSVIINFSLPVNRVEEWMNIGALEGIVSRKTQLELLSDIKDPDNEEERLRKEAEDGVAVTETNQSPEAAQARVEQQIATQIPDMQAIISPLVDSLADAALSVLLNSNKVKAAKVVDEEA